MRIGVDARHLADSRGVARYTGALLDSLAGAFPGDRWLLFVPGTGELPALERLVAYPNVSVRRHPLGGRALFGAAAIFARPRLDRLLGGPLDVVWIPAPAPLALSPDLPVVLTIHDLSFELRPHDFTPYERLWHRLARPRSLAERASIVIVPAAPTRAELVARWGLATERVRVIAEGVPAPTEGLDVGAALARFGLAPGQYLLAVGALEPRKAPLLLADAFARARQRGLRATLVFAGTGRLAARLQGRPGVKLLGRVSDEDLSALYTGAVALVVASLLEGYGLPLREALAHGTPAVVSDLPVFEEQLSPALLRFPVGDERALADALLELEDTRAELAVAARPAAAGLSWEAAARQTRAVLAEAAPN